MFLTGQKDELLKYRDTLDTELYEIESQVRDKMKEMSNRKICKPIPTAAAVRELENPKSRTGNSPKGINILKKINPYMLHVQMLRPSPNVGMPMTHKGLFF
jgi:hypothetical protein